MPQPPPEVPLLILRRDAWGVGPYDSALGGIFRSDLAADLAPTVLVVAWCVAVVTALVRAPRWLQAAAAGVAFTALVFLCSEPWDELFINLTHARNLVEHGRFSFHPDRDVEGLVDFLPYVVVAGAGWLGMPLLDAALLMSLSGGLACVAAMRALLGDAGVDGRASDVISVFFVLVPPLVFNAGQGFSTTWFTAVILWAAHAYACQRVSVLTALLAVLPLVRVEGAALSVLFVGLVGWEARGAAPGMAWLRATATRGAWTLAPLAVLTAWRAFTFGHAIPAPVRFKAALFQPEFMAEGARRLLQDAWAGGLLPALAACALSRALSTTRGNVTSPAARRLRGSLAVLTVFTATYYASGGDWFPPHWGRYMLPLSVFTVVLASALAWEAVAGGPSARKVLAWAAMVLLVAACAVPSREALRGAGLPESAPRALLRAAWLAPGGRGGFRVDVMGRIGRHLRDTTAPGTAIASSELATVMFHAERPAVDLLGVTNEEIIAMPLARRADVPGGELALQRRRPPAGIVARSMAGVVYPYDFYVTGRPDHPPALSWDRATLRDRVFDKLISADAWLAFRGMDLGTLASAGYTPVIALYRDFAALYFVSAGTLDDHRRRARDAGFTEEWAPAAHAPPLPGSPARPPQGDDVPGGPGVGPGAGPAPT